MGGGYRRTFWVRELTSDVELKEKKRIYAEGYAGGLMSLITTVRTKICQEALAHTYGVLVVALAG